MLTPVAASPEIESPAPDLIIPPKLFVIVEPAVSFKFIAFEPAALIVPVLVTVKSSESSPWTALCKLKIDPPEFTITETSFFSSMSALFWVSRFPKVIPELIVSVSELFPIVIWAVWDELGTLSTAKVLLIFEKIN